MVAESMVRSVQLLGQNANLGELRIVTPWISTRRQLTSDTILGRGELAVSRPGHQISPSLLSVPPDARRLRHCASVCLLFFTGRQESPAPSKDPDPVMAMSSRSRPEMGDVSRCPEKYQL